MDHVHETDGQDGRLGHLDEQQHESLAEHHGQQVDPHRGFPQNDLPLFADLPVGVQRAHERRHGAEDEQRRAAAHVDQVGGKTVGVRHQADDQHHEGFLQDQAGQQQFVVDDQAQVALHQYGELAQGFHYFDGAHRLSASCAASGQAAARRLNSGVVKYLRRYSSTCSGSRSFSKISLVISTSK